MKVSVDIQLNVSGVNSTYAGIYWGNILGKSGKTPFPIPTVETGYIDVYELSKLS